MRRLRTLLQGWYESSFDLHFHDVLLTAIQVLLSRSFNEMLYNLDRPNRSNASRSRCLSFFAASTPATPKIGSNAVNAYDTPTSAPVRSGKFTIASASTTARARPDSTGNTPTRITP